MLSLSKGLKQILIVVIVITVFGMGIFIVSLAVPNPKDTAEPTAEPSPSPPVYYLIKENADDVMSIENIYSDGTSMRVNYSMGEDDMLEYEVIPGDSFFPYNTSKFRSMMYTLTSLTAVDIIEDNPADLSIYGLDDPQFQVVVTLRGEDGKEGKKITLSVGDPTPVDRNFYAMSDQENAVYKMGNYLANLIMRSELEYRDIAGFPEYTEEEKYTNINYVSMTKRDGTVIEIALDMELEHSGNIASSAYVMLSPVISSCSDEVIQESVIDPVALLNNRGILKDVPSEEIKDYGFDQPARLILGDVEGNRLDLTIGALVDDDVPYYYVAITAQYEASISEGVDLTVMMYGTEAFTWLDINYTTLMNRSAWLQSIHEVESIDYEMDGTTYHIELFRYDDVTGSGVDVVRTEGILNGKNVTEANTKRLYGRTLNLRQIGEIPKGVDLSSPQYTITMHLLDGGIRTLELVKLNERQYACVVDGVAEFYIYQSNIQNLLIALERIMDDRNVPLVYYT